VNKKGMWGQPRWRERREMERGGENKQRKEDR